MNSIRPLVSCIMPTANREKFIPYAIHYFLRQDYPNKELIIVDDGIMPIDHLFPPNKMIKYFRLKDRNVLIGEKRNYACSMAGGEIIMHMDDDDWYAANWISHQVDVLQAGGADICGLARMLFYSPHTGQSWQYVYPSGELPWVGGATLAYRRSAWEKSPFEHVQVGEDNQFVWNSHTLITPHSYVDGFVSILHPGNTSPKYTTNERWQVHTLSGIERVLKDDYLNYSGGIENKSGA